jgi:hypothetical protein
MHLHHPLPIFMFKRSIATNTISEHSISVCIIPSHTSILVVRVKDKEIGFYCAMAFKNLLGV